MTTEIKATGLSSFKQETEYFFGTGMIVDFLKHWGIITLGKGHVKYVCEDTRELTGTV